MLIVRLTCVDGFARSGATALRTPDLFRCAAAPLRETFLRVCGRTLRLSTGGGAFGAIRGAVADIYLFGTPKSLFSAKAIAVTTQLLLLVVYKLVKDAAQRTVTYRNPQRA